MTSYQPDYTRLNALELMYIDERIRLAAAKTEQEKDLHQVCLMQTEKEITAEYKFLGIEQPKEMFLVEIFDEMDFPKR